MAVVDERVGEVHRGRLDLAVQQQVRVADEELLQGVVAGDEDPQALALTATSPAPLLPEAGHGARVADGDGRVEGADVDAQLERGGADHGQELPAEQLGLDSAALLGRVSGPVGGQALGQRLVGLAQAVGGELVYDLGRPPRLREADGAHLVFHQFRQQLGRLCGGAAADVQVVLHQRRLPEHDLAGANRSPVAADVGDVHPREVHGMLPGIADGGRSQDEAGFRIVQGSHTA